MYAEFQIDFMYSDSKLIGHLRGLLHQSEKYPALPVIHVIAFLSGRDANDV